MMTDLAGYPSNKIVLIVRVVVKTTRSGVAGDDEDMSYSDVSLLVLKTIYIVTHKLPDQLEAFIVGWVEYNIFFFFETLKC